MSNNRQDFDEAHDVEEAKRVRISLHLIAKRSLPPDATRWPQKKIVEALNCVSHLRLDRENIGYIDSLELLGTATTNIYLQQNKIEQIENLECLPQLQFLTLAGNRVRHVRGLAHMKNLVFLDLSDNLIHSFDIDELPQSLAILNLHGNPCTQIPDYRGRIIQDLPRLRQLDGEAVTREERQEAGYVVSSEEEDEEDDDDDEDDDADDEFEDEEASGGQSVKELLQATTSSILLRSQERLEGTLQEHQRKLELLSEIRDSDRILSMEARSRSGLTARSRPSTRLDNA